MFWSAIMSRPFYHLWPGSEIGHTRRTMRARVRALPLALALALAPCGAASEPAGASDHVAVTLLAEDASIQPGEPFAVGLRMKTAPGWHTYWKNPGDAGLPLRIEWDLPAGFRAGEIEWPAPSRFATETLMSYGYTGEVLIPVTITPPADGLADSARIAGTFRWLECEEVCLQGQATLDLKLAVSSETPAPGPDAPAFEAARARLPVPSREWRFSAEAGPRAIALSFRTPEGSTPRRAYFYVDRPLVLEHAAPQGFETREEVSRLTFTAATNAPAPPERLTGVLVVEGLPNAPAPIAVQVDVPVSPGDPAPAPVPSSGPSPRTTALTGAGVAALFLVMLALRRQAPRRRRFRRESGDPGR
jgi:DsbC/DsbD-like thiol-disulfide interchange protein